MTILSSEVNQISLSKELTLLDNTNTVFSSLLLNKGVEKGSSTIVQWQLENLDSSDGLALEGADATEFQKSARSYEKNVMQILSKAINLSGTSTAVSAEAIADIKAHEINNRMLEIKRDLEKYLVTGTYRETETSTLGRQMKGLVNFATAGNTISQAGAITLANLQEMAKKMRKNGVSSQDMVLLCSYDVMDSVQTLFADKVQYQGVTNEFGSPVMKINLTYGSAVVYTVDAMPEKTALLVNMDHLKISELRPLQYENLGKTGDSEKGILTVENTLKVLNTNAITKFVDTSA